MNIYGRSRICNPVERIGLLTYIRRLSGGVLPPRQVEIRTSLPFHFVGLTSTLFTIQAFAKSVDRFFICDRKLRCKTIRYLFTAVPALIEWAKNCPSGNERTFRIFHFHANALFGL